MDHALHWTGFNLFVLLLLGLDMITSRPQDQPLTMRQAVTRSIFWVMVGLGVNVWVYYQMGAPLAMDFFSAYLLEKSLSVDNLFVCLIIFKYFKVPQPSQQRVLLFGVLGALLMRGSLIFAGISLVNRYSWILYIFAIILIVSGIKLARADDDNEVDPEQNPSVRWVRKHFPLHPQYVGRRMFVKIDGKTMITPLFVVLVAVETTDLFFAMDSIPAVFGVSQDSFIVYSSNVMAILGLRALYFALAGLMGMFHYLQVCLSIILVFIGTEMLLVKWVHISTPVELGVIAGLLGLSVVASIVFPKKEDPSSEEIDSATAE